MYSKKLPQKNHFHLQQHNQEEQLLFSFNLFLQTYYLWCVIHFFKEKRFHKDARDVPLMANERGELETRIHGKNFIQITVNISTGIHKTPNKQDWKWFNSNFSLWIPINIPKGLMRNSPSHKKYWQCRMKLTLKILRELVRELNF